MIPVAMQVTQLSAFLQGFAPPVDLRASVSFQLYAHTSRGRTVRPWLKAALSRMFPRVYATERYKLGGYFQLVIGAPFDAASIAMLTTMQQNTPKRQLIPPQGTRLQNPGCHAFILGCFSIFGDCPRPRLQEMLSRRDREVSCSIAILLVMDHSLVQT